MASRSSFWGGWSASSHVCFGERSSARPARVRRLRLQQVARRQRDGAARRLSNSGSAAMRGWSLPAGATPGRLEPESRAAFNIEARRGIVRSS